MRSDGMWVVQCAVCGMGVVEKPPVSTQELYQDDYYHGAGEREIGYSDYSFVAEHGTAWAASLTRMLAPSGRVLDIGCANGHLLNKLLASHECYGIEVNPRMAGICASAGVRMIGADVFDPQISERYAASFDVVLALAVLEHVSDFRQAVRVALHLLKPEGTLVFEVPLMSSVNSNDVWFRSSLEHIYYPSERALHHLIEKVFGLALAGSELPIMDYASTFVGLVSKDRQRGEELERLFRRLALGPAAALATKEERMFRLLFGLIHAAQTTSDHLDLLRRTPLTELDPLLFQRLMELWIREQQRLESTQSYLQVREQKLDAASGELARIKSSKYWRLLNRFVKL